MDVDVIDGLFEFGIVIGVTVSGWIVTRQVRRRMKKSLGRSASDLDLVSFRAWNEVKNIEQRKAESGPIHPK
jgi:hypothetical protein